MVSEVLDEIQLLLLVLLKGALLNTEATWGSHRVASSGTTFSDWLKTLGHRSAAKHPVLENET